MAHFNDLHIREFPKPENLNYRGRWVNNWFSNFARVGNAVSYRGWTTYCLEQAFVAAKNPDYQVKDPQDSDHTISFAELAMNTNDASKVKRLGSSKSGVIKLREDWDYVNIAAMDLFLRQRWQPDGSDIEKLLSQPSPIVEYTNWGDNRWGVTLNDMKGRNALGLLLEAICEEIREGCFYPGADEKDWFTRQEYLVERLNLMQCGRIVGTQIDHIDLSNKFC